MEKENTRKRKYICDNMGKIIIKMRLSRNSPQTVDLVNFNLSLNVFKWYLLK